LGFGIYMALFLATAPYFLVWSGLNLALIMMIYRPYNCCIVALHTIILSSLRAKALRTSFARSLSLTIGCPASFAVLTILYLCVHRSQAHSCNYPIHPLIALFASTKCVHTFVALMLYLLAGYGHPIAITCI
jgi:hypothetical protein